MRSDVLGDEVLPIVHVGEVLVGLQVVEGDALGAVVTDHQLQGVTDHLGAVLAGVAALVLAELAGKDDLLAGAVQVRVGGDLGRTPPPGHALDVGGLPTRGVGAVVGVDRHGEVHHGEASGGDVQDWVPDDVPGDCDDVQVGHDKGPFKWPDGCRGDWLAPPLSKETKAMVPLEGRPGSGEDPDPDDDDDDEDDEGGHGRGLLSRG